MLALEVGLFFVEGRVGGLEFWSDAVLRGSCARSRDSREPITQPTYWCHRLHDESSPLKVGCRVSKDFSFEESACVFLKKNPVCYV